MTITTTIPAQRTSCPVCGKAHRAGSKAAATCAALAATVTTPAPDVVVTVEHLRDVLAGWDSALARIDGPGGPLLVVVPVWAAGEVLVDRDDVFVLLDHLGSLAAVAADLTAALAWELTHGGAA